MHKYKHKQAYLYLPKLIMQIAKLFMREKHENASAIQQTDYETFTNGVVALLQTHPHSLGEGDG